MTKNEKPLGLGGGGYEPEYKVAEGGGLAAGRDVVEVNDPKQDLNNYTVDMKEMKKLMKKYKRLKKFVKSPMYQIKKLSGQRTIIEDLVDEYNKSPEE